MDLSQGTIENEGRIEAGESQGGYVSQQNGAHGIIHIDLGKCKTITGIHYTKLLDRIDANLKRKWLNLA